MEVFMRMPKIHIDELPQRCRVAYDRFVQYFNERPDHFLSRESGYLIGPWDASRMIQPTPQDFVPVARKERSGTGRNLWRLRFADAAHLPEICRKFPGLLQVNLEGYAPRPRRKPAGMNGPNLLGPLVGRPVECPESPDSFIEAAIERSGKPRAVWVQEALLAKARSELFDASPR
jgi:hypothetical protein